MEQLTSKSTQFDNAYRHHQIMTFAQFTLQNDKWQMRMKVR